VNTKPLGFSECENDEGTQEIVLKESDFKGEIPLKFVKFQAVKTLTIFFSENEGGDKTKIVKLGLFGNSEKETDVRKKNFNFFHVFAALDEKLKENLLRQQVKSLAHKTNTFLNKNENLLSKVLEEGEIGDLRIIQP
jgi:hypothetical protein